MTESETTAKVHKEMKKLGWWTWKIAGGYYGRKGMPDSLFLKDGKHRWVEAKNPETVLEPLQEQTIKTMRYFGGQVYTLRYYANVWILNESTEPLMINFDKFEEAVTKLSQFLYADGA